LKRTFPQKAKPVPACAVEGRTTTGQARQSLPEVNRRARTSAAMIGLAISMGAHSLLIPRQSDSAMAAEPVAPEASVTAAPAAFEAAMLSPTNEAESAAVGFSTPDSVVEHTVQEGQTLWQLAQVYQVNPAIIAAANGVALDSVIHVGQTLKIPSAAPAQVESQTSSIEVVSPVPVAVAPLAPTASLEADPLKLEEEAALERLKQKRDALQAGLAELKTETKSAPVEVPTVEVPTVEVPASAQTKSLQSEGEVPPQVAYQPPAMTVAPTLPIPAPQPEVKETEVGSYRVKRGDTLDAIARKHGVSRAELARFNRLSNPNFILVNQVLKVPQKVSNQATAVIPGLPTNNAPITIASNKPTVPIAPGLASTQEQPGLEVQLGAGGTQPEFKGSVAAVPTTLPATVPSVPASPETEGTVKEQKIVTLSPAISPSPQSDSSFSESNQNRYVENLRVEINQLREKYEAEGKPSRSATQSQALAELSKPTATVAVKLPTTARQINPEFAAVRQSTGSKPNARDNRQVDQAPASQKAPATKSQPDSELVAVAPLGSEAYEPIIQSALGQMVSPDLPPIGTADAYLPEGAPQFKGHIWPAKGVLTSGYGWRWGRMHRGIDIAAPIGTPVVASAAGVVVTAGWNSGGYGNLVEIRHPDGSLTLYAHNNRILVREGQQVEQGQQIAEMGSTGYSTGPHSHFEVHLPGRGAVNPLAHLPRSRG
jgi:murein DD-endopeptidase MepM/ murein hydrolase activator NlpD